MASSPTKKLRYGYVIAFLLLLLSYFLILYSTWQVLSGFDSKAKTIVIISLIAALFAIGFSLFIYKQERRAKNELNKQTNQYRKELEESIIKLTTLNKELTALRSIEKFAATGHVARTIAHEVRNPLTNISLATEQLQTMCAENAESSQLMDMINRNTVRINQLVSDLLNATRAIDLKKQRIHISWLIDETLEMAWDRIGLKRIKIEKSYDPALYEIEVDIEKIKIAFLNIIVNAIEAMDAENSVLSIKTKKENDKCIVEISDNGKGMDENTIQRIFEPYFTRKPTGTGLGLTNTQNIIISHKGNIEAKSQLGAGTTFVISLEIKSSN